MCLAYPMKIKKIKGKIALCISEGIEKEVNIELLKKVKLGDYVMVHAGFAIEKVEKKEAKKTLKIFKDYQNALRKMVEKR